MVRRCAAVPRTLRHRPAQVGSSIPTWQAMVSAESPSYTALIVTTNYRQSPFLEILQLLESCELATSQCCEK